MTLNANSQKGILLVHGLTGTPTEMKLLGRSLKQAGFKIDIPLLAGHGTTSEELLATHYEDWLQTVKTHYEQLRQECSEVYIAGMCMGGMLGLMLATQNLKTPPDGVIVMGPHLDYFSDKTTLLRYLLPFLYRIPLPRFITDKIFWAEEPPYGLKDERLIKKITQEINKCEDTAHGTFRTYLTSFLQMNRLNQTVKKQAFKIKCPVLLLQAIDDSFLSPKNALRLYQLLGSNKKQLVFLNGTDHMLPIDLRKKEVWNWIRQFAETRNVMDGYDENYQHNHNPSNYEMIFNATEQRVNWSNQEIQVYRQGKCVTTISAQVAKKELVSTEIIVSIDVLYSYIDKLAFGNHLFKSHSLAKATAAIFSVITSVF